MEHERQGCMEFLYNGANFDRENINRLKYLQISMQKILQVKF